MRTLEPRKCRSLLLLAVGTLLLLAAGAPQEETGDIELIVTVGFGGYVNQTDWIPVRVVATNNGPTDVVGELQVSAAGMGGSSFHFVRPIDLPRGVRKEVFLYIRVEGYASALDVALMDGNTPLASQRVSLLAVGQSDWLIGIVSDAPGTLSALGAVTPEGGSGRTHLTTLAMEDLPPVAAAWSALDVLVFSDVDTGALSEAQHRTLRAWVSDGGQLIVVGGTGYQRTFAGLGELLPLTPTGDATTSLEPIADYIGRPFPARLPTDAPVAVGTPAPGSHVAIGSPDAPLVIWQAHGAGRVILLTADPGLEPLRSWNGMTDFWQAILSTGASSLPWRLEIGSAAYSGWGDARTAASHIPGAELPPAALLLAFAAVYVLLIGPVNYLLLRWLRRLELAWLTVPALAVAFTWLAYTSGIELRGSQAIVHRLAMVQIWPDSDDARVNGLLEVWSPRRTRYDVGLGAGFLARPMPADYGGVASMYDHTLEQRTDTEAFLSGMRVDIGSGEAFVIDGSVSADAAPAVRGDFTIEERTGSQGLTISGQVINESDRDLRNVAVLALGQAHYLGDLPPGESREVMLVVPARPASAAVPQPSAYAYGYYPSSSVYPYAYGASYYDLPSGMLGGVTCYDDMANTARIRECNLLESIFNYESGNWLNQIYVVAWDEAPLMPITITDADFEGIDLNVYFMRMSFRLADQANRIPPMLTTWAYVPGQGGATYATTPQPYDYALGADESAVFRFEPLPEIGAPANLDTVILHLQGLGGSGNPPFTVALWNWERGHYTAVDAVWGDLTIRNAGAFIGESGAVQVQVVGNGETGARIDRLDVTLVGGGG